ncbi:MAG: peptidoglycan-binding domain-containing protein [Maritimibacter sp.]
MPTLLSRATPRLSQIITIVLALTLAVVFLPPRAARADAADAIGGALAVGIIGATAYCIANPHKCGDNRRRAPSGQRTSRPSGPADAIGLNRTQKTWIQQTLQTDGHYKGAIDGSFGAGSRAAVRSYQTVRGEPATGALSGAQINDLVRRSPTFAAYAETDVYLFNADLARDLDRDGVRALQGALNERGFNAGPVDGAFGGKTRVAITAYKAQNGLPGGPLPTRRLLAHVTGAPLVISSMGRNAGQTAAPMQAAQAATMPAIAPKPAGQDMRFDLSGVSLGMSSQAAMAKIQEALGADMILKTGGENLFGDGSSYALGVSAYQPAWPAPPSEQFVTVIDPTRPQLGVVAAFRLIQVPSSVDQAAFEQSILPNFVARYGEVARIPGQNTWVGKADARATYQANPIQAANCGFMVLEAAGDTPTFAPQYVGSVQADCGEVLSISLANGMVNVSLWNSSAFVPGAPMVPEIKF